MRHAAPIPCSTRITISHIAPERPVIQSMVSSSEATRVDDEAEVVDANATEDVAEASQSDHRARC